MLSVLRRVHPVNIITLALLSLLIGAMLADPLHARAYALPIALCALITSLPIRLPRR